MRASDLRSDDGCGRHRRGPMALPRACRRQNPSLRLCRRVRLAAMDNSYAAPSLQDQYSLVQNTCCVIVADADRPPNPWCLLLYTSSQGCIWTDSRGREILHWLIVLVKPHGIFVSVNGSWIGKTKVCVSENHMQIHVNSFINTRPPFSRFRKGRKVQFFAFLPKPVNLSLAACCRQRRMWQQFFYQKKCYYNEKKSGLEISSSVFQLQKKIKQEPLSESAEASKAKLFCCKNYINN